MHLALASSPKSFSSLLSYGVAAVTCLKTRERYLELDTEITSVLIFCHEKILLGLRSGRISIYNTIDLQCEAALRFCKYQVQVSGLECICPEIIANYSDGSLRAWDIRSKPLIATIISEGRNSERFFCLELRKPYLVLNISRSKVEIWEWGEDTQSLTLTLN